MRRKRRDSGRKNDAWSDLAGRHGAAVEADRKGRAKLVSFPHGALEIVLDRFIVSTGQTSQTFTRVHVLYGGAEDFRLKVRGRNPFHALAGLFGVRRVELGYGRFDRTFFVTGTDHVLSRSLLRGTTVGQMLLEDPKVRLEIKRPGKRIRKGAGEDVREIQLYVPGLVTDVTRLEALVRLCRETIDQLIQLGVARTDSVAARLQADAGRGFRSGG